MESLLDFVAAGFSIDWKYQLGSGATLYNIAERADDLVQPYLGATYNEYVLRS